MAILITGGRGFVGPRSAEHLRGAGREIILLEEDLTKREEILKFTNHQPIEAIVHAAGVIGGRNEAIFRRVNIEGTRNIVALGQKLGVKKFIFLSTLRVLFPLSDPYIDSKREAEKIVSASGLAYTILRPSLIYGPGDNKNITSLVRLLKNLPLAPVFDFQWQPIFIEDLLLVINQSLERPGNEAINLAGRETINYTDIINLLKNKGYGIRVLNVPRFWGLVLKVFSWLPFSPLTNWQVKTLLSKQVVSEYGWYDSFSIKGVSFSEGLDKLLKSV